MDATKIDAVDPRAAHLLDKGVGMTRVVAPGTTVSQDGVERTYPEDDAVQALFVGSTVVYSRGRFGVTINAISPTDPDVFHCAAAKTFGEAFNELKHVLAIAWNQINTPPRKAGKKKAKKKKAAAKSTTRSSKSPRA